MEAIWDAPCFILHMTKHVERVPVYQKIQHAGFKKVHWYKAVDGNHLPSVRSVLSRIPLSKLDPRLTSGALGCLLSHLSLLQQIIQLEIPVATIFEDDVMFHPEWDTLAPQYMEETMKAFPHYGVLFLGNQLDSCRMSQVSGPALTQEPVYCTHAYSVTLEGAKQLYQTLVHWDPTGTPYSGITIIDYMIKETQRRSHVSKYYPFVWVSWDGTRHPCPQNRLPLSLEHCRNSGLVFQDTRLPTTVQGTHVAHIRPNLTLRPSSRTPQRALSFFKIGS
jgi:GR25 family glycosyltransferase involved in LPS biosynthesis